MQSGESRRQEAAGRTIELTPDYFVPLASLIAVTGLLLAGAGLWFVLTLTGKARLAMAVLIALTAAEIYWFTIASVVYSLRFTFPD